MKKKLAISAFCIVVAVAVIAGGTLAWVTDTDTIPTNTFVAGVLSMDVDDVFDYEDNTYDGWTPGDDIEKLVQITNDGTKRAFLRAQITEVRTQSLHFEGTALVEYLHALDASNESTQLPGIFAATMSGGQWIVPYDVDGNPIAFGAPGFGAGDGYSGIYVTNLGGYVATSWSGINGDTSPTYAPVRKLANTSDPASGLVPIPGSSIDVFRVLPEAQWRVTTTQLRDMPNVQWYIGGATPFAGGLWQNIGNYWYFNQAIYPAGYDETPNDGNDNPAFAATVAPFLTSVEFVPSAMDNTYQGSVYTIDVTFETIQVTNGASTAAWGRTFSQDLTTNLAANVIGTWS
jgi:predicted ribosomally synthesized peptide with SipW-like signal peptide